MGSFELREDDELRIARGEREAFVAFFERFFAPVWAFARRRAASEADAEALVERILAAALDAVADGASDGPLAERVHACALAAAADGGSAGLRPAEPGSRSGTASAWPRPAVGTPR